MYYRYHSHRPEEVCPRCGDLLRTGPSPDERGERTESCARPECQAKNATEAAYAARPEIQAAKRAWEKLSMAAAEAAIKGHRPFGVKGARVRRYVPPCPCEQCAEVRALKENSDRLAAIRDASPE